MEEDKTSFHFNNDIWFISGSEIAMTLAIMEHLLVNKVLKSAICRYEARKICAIYLDLPVEIVEEIDREYQCNGKVELNLKMGHSVYYKIMFKNEHPYLTLDIKHIEDEYKPSFSEKDLQDQAQLLKRSHISKMLYQHANHSLDIDRLCFEEGPGKRCTSNYIIKLWNYCVCNGFMPYHKMGKLLGTFPYDETYEILKNQLDNHGLFEEGWKRFDRLLDGYETKDLLRELIASKVNKICLPFKTTHNSYELNQDAVPIFWDQVFSNIEERDKRQKMIPDLDEYSAGVLQKSNIIDILATMEHLQLIKSNWSIVDRRKVCAIYHQIHEPFIAQIHNEFLIKKKIEMSFTLRKGEGGKLLFLSDNEIKFHLSPSQDHQEVSSEEIMQVAETLKWSSYAKFLANYYNVSILKIV